MSDDLEMDLASRLMAGERLLWSGRPPRGFLLRGQDAVLIPFSLVWCAFFAPLVLGFLLSGDPSALFGGLFMVPFVIVGLYMLVGRFWMDVRQRGRTLYAVTDSRIIILAGVFSRTVKSVTLRTLGDVALTELNDGSGTITFGPSSTNYGAWQIHGWNPALPPMFERIPEARTVYETILRAQKAASA